MQSLQHLTQNTKFKRIIVILFFGISAGLWLISTFYNRNYVSTDDAYVNANVVQVASRIAGKVNDLLIKNNQYVTQYQTLFMIDPEPLQLAVNSAKAELNVSLVELDNAERTKNRVLSLVQKKYLSPQEGDNVIAIYKTALAKVERAKSMLAQAQLNLSYTLTKTPSSGWITNMSLRMGDIVPANQSLFALISDQEFWIDANFKETDLAKIEPGQTAEIISDVYPKHKFHGIVESISGGTGSAFSLLPPQNATGNWVKVTQRVPVRIRVINLSKAYPLRIGTSASVTIDIRKKITIPN